jgi:Lrp/AsnC family transcriptional regulator for asnA, asnC and gidA
MSDANKDEVLIIDEMDKKIIKLINEDARTSYRHISRELDVSVGTIHNRVEKLMKAGVIKKFTPIFDHSKLGYDLTCIINVKLIHGQLDDWNEKESLNRHILAIYEITGEYDIFLITKFKDSNDLNIFIKELLKEPNVERTYTQTVLNVVKEELSSICMI